MIPFIVISYACFALCIVVVLLGRKGTEEDKNLRRMKTLGKDVVKADYKNVETSFYERNIKPMIDNMSNKNNENQSKSARVKAENEQIAKKLRKAGLHISVSNFKFFKMAGYKINLSFKAGNFTFLLFKIVITLYHIRHHFSMILKNSRAVFLFLLFFQFRLLAQA